MRCDSLCNAYKGFRRHRCAFSRDISRMLSPRGHAVSFAPFRSDLAGCCFLSCSCYRVHFVQRRAGTSENHPRRMSGEIITKLASGPKHPKDVGLVMEPSTVPLHCLEVEQLYFIEWTRARLFAAEQRIPIARCPSHLGFRGDQGSAPSLIILAFIGCSSQASRLYLT